MGRVIAIGPGGRAQAPERSDRCRPVIDYVIASGLLDRVLLSPESVALTYAQADELRRAICLSARYYCSCGRMYCTRKWGNVPGQNPKNPEGGCPVGGQRVGCDADVVKDGKGRYRVQFRLMDKRETMRWVVLKYGPDPNEWPYYARRKRIRK